MSNDLSLKQTAGLDIIRKAVKCSKCGESRTQVLRCENCGFEKHIDEERKNNA